MELKEFIKETLIQITDGIREGHQYIEDGNYGNGVHDDYFNDIDFDVAITSNDEQSSGVGGKISVANLLNIGGDSQNVSKQINVSRIQFTVKLHVKTRNKTNR